MQPTEYIIFIINKLPKGHVFTYGAFTKGVKNKETIIKALNRMAATGSITKLAKGKYFKPENTIFGNLVPNQKQIVKDLLEKQGKIIGYLTGYSIYNKLGLTTQVSNVIQIGRKETKPALKRANYKITFIPQKNTITKANIPLLQILDCLRYIKNIPGTDTGSACKRLLAILKRLKFNDRKVLAKLALTYPPATKALLGALLEQVGNPEFTLLLRKTLNPITSYKIPGACKVLRKAKNWNIV